MLMNAVARPLPLARWPAAAARATLGVFTDIDDTLTRDGAIEPVALEALGALRAAGIAVVAITGRPMGWSKPFARAWPVDAIVAENGAVALIPGRARGSVDRASGASGASEDASGASGDAGDLAGAGELAIEYAQDEATRMVNSKRLTAAAERVLREVPEARLATDSAGRVTDIAVDHSEFVQLAPEAIDRVVAVMRAEGLNATVSSIHVNGWYGAHDKPSGARWMVRRLFGRELDREIERWVYVGDSTNDQAMFARFPQSVGVANLMHFADVLTTWPAYLTNGERGAGFAEVARAVLAARR